MKLAHALFLPVLALALSATTASAVCPTTSHIGSDAAFLSIQPEAGVACVAEGRIGDRSGAATFELDLGQSTAAPATTAQYGWVSGQAEPFTLSYSNVTGVVTFQLGGQTLAYSPAGTFTDIFLRTRASLAGTQVTVTDLVLDGCVIADQSNAVGPGLDYLRLQGVDLMAGFTLTGSATMSWAASPPSQSNLAFQVKVGTPAPPVPAVTSSWGGVKARF